MILWHIGSTKKWSKDQDSICTIYVHYLFKGSSTVLSIFLSVDLVLEAAANASLKDIANIGYGCGEAHTTKYGSFQHIKII